MQHDTASQTSKKKRGRNISEGEVFESCHLPQIPDTPIPGSGHGHWVTFRSPVTRTGLVSSIPHLVPPPVSFHLSEIPDIKTSGKDRQ